MRAAGWLTLLFLAAAPGAAAAQGLRGAVLEGGDGTVRLSFPAREGVLFCDEGIRLHGGTWVAGEGRRRDDAGCAYGPVRVEMEVGDGAVRRVATLHGRRGPTAAARELGTVDPRQAQEFLLELARSSEIGGRGSDAVFPAILADVPEGWRGVMELATDTRAPAEARKSALFWMGQEAASAATQGLASVAADEDEDQRVREAAVFALSQRPPEEGVPVLMELARTAREARTRKSAFFWLSQSGDPRVPAFFRNTILGGPGG